MKRGKHRCKPGVHPRNWFVALRARVEQEYYYDFRVIANRVGRYYRPSDSVLSYGLHAA